MVNDPDPVIKRLEDETNEGQPLPVLSEAVRSTYAAARAVASTHLTGLCASGVGKILFRQARQGAQALPAGRRSHVCARSCVRRHQRTHCSSRPLAQRGHSGATAFTCIICPLSSASMAQVKDHLMRNIKRRMTPQPLKIRTDVELTCFKYDGVLHIQACCARLALPCFKAILSLQRQSFNSLLQTSFASTL